MVEGSHEISFIKSFTQVLARGGRCYYSHLQVFGPATDSRGRFMESGWKPQGRRLQTPSEEDLPQGGRTTSGSGVSMPEHRRAEVWCCWVSGCRAKVLAVMLEQQHWLGACWKCKFWCFTPDLLNRKLHPVFYKLSRWFWCTVKSENQRARRDGNGQIRRDGMTFNSPSEPETLRFRRTQTSASPLPFPLRGHAHTISDETTRVAWCSVVAAYHP